MLNRLFTNQLQLGLAQALSAAVLAYAVVLLARRQKIHLERETTIALLRGFVQIIAVGSVLVLLLQAPHWTGAFLLAAMIGAAGATSAKRAKGFPGALEVSTWSIACGAGSVIAIMTSLGVIDTAITALIPVGSMLIANAMNTNGLVLNRFRSDVLAHVGEIESALSLGGGSSGKCSPVRPGFDRSEFNPRHRFSALTRNRLDSRPDGRHAVVRLTAHLRRRLSICCSCDDFCSVRSDLTYKHSADPQTRVHSRGSVVASPWDEQ